MTEWRDADKSIARGDVRGTRAGRAMRLYTRPAWRGEPTPRRPQARPPRDAVLVLRPKIVVAPLQRRWHWIAVDGGQLQLVASGGSVARIRAAHVAAVRVRRRGDARIEFLDAAGHIVAGAPRIYTSRQLASLANVLGVRLVER